MDTQRQNFWKESIDKEATVRLTWHIKYSKEFARSNTLPTSSQTEKAYKAAQHNVIHKAVKVSEMKPNLAKDQPRKSGLSRLVNEVSNENLNDSIRVSEMRPVTPITRKLLYKGFSAVGEGRYQYLQRRKQKKPEQKYEFPITSGWEYGWKIANSMKNSTTRPAEFGRTRIVKDSFYRTNGVMPITH